MGKEILINRMYSGDYLAAENNIGHEVINLFKDDKGNNYIYVLSDGSVAKKHNDKIQSVLLVRWVGNRTMEILAKAENLEQILRRKTANRSDRKTLHEEQIKYICENDITYGGVRLDQIMKDNIFHGQVNYDSFYITFKANKLLKPIMSIYIKDKQDVLSAKNAYFIEGVTFSMQSPKMYYSEGTSAYKVLDDIIKDDSLWESENSTEKIDPIQFEKDEKDNFLKIIGKEYDEVIFSNLLSHYFLQNAEVFLQFCKEILNIELNKKYIIERETQDNIDLLIQDDRNVIVIENKIKSGINGIKHDVYSEEIQSQLCKYYEYATELAQNNNRNVKCFIFSPNYNYLNLSNYKAGSYYTIIKYSEIYNFYINHVNDFDRYFNDFIKALYKHTLDVNNELFEEMRRRFSVKIIEHRKNS